MATKGRRGATGTFTDTISPKSAEQAMLLKIDELTAKVNALMAAIDASTDGDTLQAALAATDLTAVSLIDLK